MFPWWPLDPTCPKSSGRYKPAGLNRFRHSGVCQVCNLCVCVFCPTQLQSLPSQPHYLDGFEVLYRSLLPATSDWAAKKASLPSFQAQTGPLRRGYKYEFKVRPYGGSLYGRESNTRHLRVPETGMTRAFVLQLLVRLFASKTAVTVFFFSLQCPAPRRKLCPSPSATNRTTPSVWAGSLLRMTPTMASSRDTR